MFKKVLLIATLLGAACATQAAPIIDEGFDSVSTALASGWSQTNNSAPSGSTGWFQGIPSLGGYFDAASGAPNSYVAANFLNTGVVGNISTWLITPTFDLNNRIVLSFATRSTGFLPDRLEVRLSTNGTSGNVGSSDTSVGDFSALLLTINPLLDASYPTDWTTYKIILPTTAALGRLAFRYNVTDSGSLGLNGDYIGIDNVTVYVPEPSTLALFSIALFAVGYAMTRRRVATPAV